MVARRPRALGAVLLLCTALAAGACRTTARRSAHGSAVPARVPVVAVEDFWGSIARQLGGQHVEVESLISNPNTDPHDYEPTPADARTLARARVVITNGVGYDSWVDKLLAANPATGRRVVDVGHLMGLHAGDNPHQWYAPAAVDKAIAAITDAYARVDPSHAADYHGTRTAFDTEALGPYRAAVAGIRAQFAGVAVGASESTFAPMAEALGLRLVTPAGFLDAVSEGSEPTAGDKATVDRQIATKAIRAFVYNSQNATPDVRRLVGAAQAKGIPVVTVTETLTPQGATFQDWQTRQLEQLRSALNGGPAA